MEAFRRIVMVGTAPTWNGKRRMSVWVTIEWSGVRLSITGVEGPMKTGNAMGGCGQIQDGLGEVDKPAPGWTVGMIAELQKVWGRWHLNDMRAGCEHQRDLGWTYDEHPSEPCATCGYKFGTAWLTEEVPGHVLGWLFSLPEADKVHPWGH